MNFFKGHIVGVFLLCMCSALYGQVSNPFEIKNRVNSTTNTEISAPPATSESPVEDVTVTQSESLPSEIPVNNVTSENQDTIEDIAEEPVTVNENSEEELSFIERQQKKILSENPFNVSHIPIRRGQKSIKNAAGSAKIKSEPAEPEKVTAEEKKAEIKTADQNERSQIVVSDDSPKKNNFIFWFILIQLLLLSSLISISRDFLKKVYRSINNDNFSKLISRDYNAGYHGLFGILYIIFILSMSIFVYLCIRHLFGVSGVVKYLMILAGVFGVYLIRHVFMGFLSVVFPFSKAINYYNFMIILFNSFLGLVLIPINLVIAFAPSSISVSGVYIGMGAVAICYILRFLRGSFNAYTYIRNYLFHFFLYLCSCEFAPIIILVKFISKFFIS